MRRDRTKNRDASPRATVEVPLRGRRNRKAADNSLQFFARIEGEQDEAGRLRGANGMRWRLS